MDHGPEAGEIQEKRGTCVKGRHGGVVEKGRIQGSRGVVEKGRIHWQPLDREVRWEYQLHTRPCLRSIRVKSKTGVEGR